MNTGIEGLGFVKQVLNNCRKIPCTLRHTVSKMRAHANKNRTRNTNRNIQPAQSITQLLEDKENGREEDNRGVCAGFVSRG